MKVPMLDEDNDLGRDRILKRVLPWFVDEAHATAWFEKTALPGYGTKTASDLVREDRAKLVLRYLDAVEASIHV